MCHNKYPELNTSAQTDSCSHAMPYLFLTLIVHRLSVTPPSVKFSESKAFRAGDSSIQALGFTCKWKGKQSKDFESVGSCIHQGMALIFAFPCFAGSVVSLFLRESSSSRQTPVLAFIYMWNAKMPSLDNN